MAAVISRQALPGPGMLVGRRPVRINGGGAGGLGVGLPKGCRGPSRAAFQHPGTPGAHCYDWFPYDKVLDFFLPIRSGQVCVCELPAAC